MIIGVTKTCRCKEEKTKYIELSNFIIVHLLVYAWVINRNTILNSLKGITTYDASAYVFNQEIHLRIVLQIFPLGYYIGVITSTSRCQKPLLLSPP